MMPPPMALFDPEDTNRRFVGTPDYLAPETINGEKQDETSDWWSVGCIMFEFMYGFPPFHAGEAEHVFENILARKIQWPDETECEISDEAKDLINKLLCMEPSKRLGSNLEDKFQSGGEEIRSHPWFNGINWDTLVEDEAQFVPQTEDPEDTEYFDARGAVLQSFAEEMEDQTSPPSSAAGSDYPDRPHDALSRGVYWADLPLRQRIAFVTKVDREEAASELKATGQMMKKDPLSPVGWYFRPTFLDP
ncbi:hypothetical protein BN1708_016554, partial [Verticillium longisporum]